MPYRQLIVLSTTAFALFFLATTAKALIEMYVPVVFWDQWETITMYEAMRDEDWSIADWFALHNEHRIFVPRLFYWADFAWAQGSDLLNLSSIAIIQLLHGMLLFCLIVQSNELQTWARISAGALIAATVLALAQVSNLRWGFQIPFVGVYAAASAAFAACAKIEPQTQPGATTNWNWLALTLAMGFTATFCMANGIIVWPILILLALVIGTRPRCIVIISLVGVAVTAGYLNGYVTPAHHSSPIESLKQPVQLILYLCTYLGNPLQAAGPGFATLAGGASLLAYAGLVFSVARKNRHWTRAQLVLLAIATFVVLSGGITAAGRVNFGVDQALTSRYATPALIYWICMLGMLWRAVGNWQFSRFPLGASMCAAGLAALIASLSYLQLASFEQRRVFKVRKAPAQTALLTGVRDYKSLKSVASLAADETIRRAQVMARYGKAPFHDGLVDMMMQPIKDQITARTSGCSGEISGFVTVQEDPGSYRVFGWSWDDDHDQVPETIIMTDESGVIRGLARSGFPRQYLLKATKNVRSGHAGWFGHLKAPLGKIMAYALMPDGTSCLFDTAAPERDAAAK